MTVKRKATPREYVSGSFALIDGAGTKGITKNKKGGSPKKSTAKHNKNSKLKREITAKKATVRKAVAKKMIIADTENNRILAATKVKSSDKIIYPKRKNSHGTFEINKAEKNLDELYDYIKDLEEKFMLIGDDAQLANIELQNMLQKQQQTLQTISNVSKMLHDTAMSVIRKFG